ncbi:MAG: hypothetical protein KDB90_16905, partial [Planctomycetes bacterium]|nr:hypothetical protein [Planctomycetota bacterium]
GLIPVLWWFDAGSSRSYRAEYENTNLWHLLWGTPLAVIVDFVVMFACLRIAGHLAGLRRIPVRRRVGLPVLNGIGGIAFFAIWSPPDDAPSRSRYWTMLALADGMIVGIGLVAVGLAAVFWNHALVRDLLLVYGAVTCVLAGGTLSRSKSSAPPTRGELLHRLAFDGPSSVALDALGRLARRASEGQRPEDWDTSLVIRLLEVRDGSMLQLQGLWLAYLHYAEAKEFSRADEVLNEAVVLAQRHNARACAWVMLESAYAQALRGDGLHARQIYDQIDHRLLHKIHTPLFQVALAINEGNHEAYSRALTSAKALPQNPGLSRELAQLETRAAERFGKEQNG